MLLDKKVYGVAGRGDKDISVFFLEYTLVLVLNDRSADSRFFNIFEAELFQSATHSLYSYALIVRYERRSKADENGIVAVKQDLCFFNTVYYFFCVLWACYEALTAPNAFVSYDMRLVAGKANRFNRAVAYTFISVIAV